MSATTLPRPPKAGESGPAFLPPMTREEYREFDRGAHELRYEWIDGEVRAVSGGTFNHGQVAANLARLLGNLFSGRALVTHSQSTRTRVPDGPYYYPDVVTVPFPPEFAEESEETFAAPVLVAEVLSPSTARIDRGEKRREYFRIPSLENYLIVQPNVREILRLTRDGEQWAERRFRAEDVDLPRFGVTLPADAIYEDCLPGERIG
ncbi:Uma2 family endonuclease [Alienimonas sp. DA493]|uniref:Uma2 family endonuclease n=1 Tax=Alienimonas sp. DA493 TaxID=3373605 RepID=UPI003754B6F3